MQTPMNGHNGKKRYVSPSDSLLSPVSMALRRRAGGKPTNKPRKLVARKLVTRTPSTSTGAGASGCKVKIAKDPVGTVGRKAISSKGRLPAMSPPSLHITKALLAQKKLKAKVTPGAHRTPMSKKALGKSKGNRHSALSRGVKPRTPLGGLQRAVANR